MPSRRRIVLIIYVTFVLCSHLLSIQLFGLHSFFLSNAMAMSSVFVRCNCMHRSRWSFTCWFKGRASASAEVARIDKCTCTGTVYSNGVLCLWEWGLYEFLRTYRHFQQEPCHRQGCMHLRHWILSNKASCKENPRCPPVSLRRFVLLFMVLLQIRRIVQKPVNNV